MNMSAVGVQIFTCWKAADAVLLPARIDALHAYPVDVFVRQHRVRRTIEQNARLWWLHGLMAAHLNALWPERAAKIIATASPGKLEAHLLLTKVWTADDCHSDFKLKYCGGKSSTRIAKMDMVDAQAGYERDLVEAGIEIPEYAPDIREEEV